MKKIIIINNNMKVGGVQKSLYSLLWAIHDKYDVTLLLFQPVGTYMEQLPDNVTVLSVDSLFRYLGVSQGECADRLFDRLMRGGLAAACRLFGRDSVLKMMLQTQKMIPGHYDCAISFLHNGREKSFYGGVNEFVLNRISADRKVGFLHGDYAACGGAYEKNHENYRRFDAVAACSEGCRKAFLAELPELTDKCFVVPNCHRFEEIRELSQEEPLDYPDGKVHILSVARLSHEKGIERALTAIAKAVESGCLVDYHIVGDGNMRQQLQTLAGKLGIAGLVHFHGEQSNPYRFMANADLLLISSYHEAAPLVIGEAHCLGLPVLSVRTTSSDEMIAQMGGGWVCENGQDALNDSLIALLKHPERISDCRLALKEIDFNNSLAVSQFAKMIGDL